nr:hypothetical protein [uncultured Arsenicibacter sp.]
MKTSKESFSPVIVPERPLKGKDGKPLFAEKIARANAAFAKAGIPKFPKEG